MYECTHGFSSINMMNYDISETGQIIQMRKWRTYKTYKWIDIL